MIRLADVPPHVCPDVGVHRSPTGVRCAVDVFAENRSFGSGVSRVSDSSSRRRSSVGITGGFGGAESGGNAVDAAVASSFALSVVRPYSCGIGGGGFMVVFLREHPRMAQLTSGKSDVVTTCINYRETAIASMGPEYFEKDQDPDAPTRGGKAVAIPGHVAGMLHALEKYGTLTREQVLAPAIRYAEQGYIADAHYEQSSQEIIEWINAAPGRAERFEFLWERLLKKGAIKAGDRIELPEQGKVLRAIAAEGLRGFTQARSPMRSFAPRALTAVKSRSMIFARTRLKSVRRS